MYFIQDMTEQQVYPSMQTFIYHRFIIKIYFISLPMQRQCFICRLILPNIIGFSLTDYIHARQDDNFPRDLPGR